MNTPKTSIGERSLAVFIDFENLALGFHGRNDRFEITLVLKRLLEKGKLVAKKAYCDWSRFSSYTASLHEAAIELVEIPKRGQTGKNSADIRLCVDAMDLAYSKEHIDTFVIVSGDSDFSPLVSKLKELGKHVIGLGMANSTSNLLRDNCDEFIYYEDLSQDVSFETVINSDLPDMKKKAFILLLNALAALRRENKETLWSSMVKDTMKRMRPSFNETYHGYKSFSELLEDAQREGLLKLETDQKSGSYVVAAILNEFRGLVRSGTAPAPQKPAPRPRVPSRASAPMPPPINPPANSTGVPLSPVVTPNAAVGTTVSPSAEPAKRRPRGGRGRGRGRGLKKADSGASSDLSPGQPPHAFDAPLPPGALPKPSGNDDGDQS